MAPQGLAGSQSWRVKPPRMPGRGAFQRVIDVLREEAGCFEGGDVCKLGLRDIVYFRAWIFVHFCERTGNGCGTASNLPRLNRIPGHKISRLSVVRGNTARSVDQF